MRAGQMLACTATMATALGLTLALPKFEDSDKDQAVNYGDNYYGGTGNESRADYQGLDEIQGSRPPRFGFPVYTQDVQTGNVLPGVYGPVRLDIGGLVLGTIVGLGAFFLLPKLLQVVPNPYGPYKRSEDLGNGENGSISDVFSRIQESLEAYNLDTSACLQRAVCSSLQAAVEKVGNGTANNFENIVDAVARNDLFLTLLDGTDWKKAVTIAENGENCGVHFQKCPNELVTVINAVSNYLMPSA